MNKIKLQAHRGVSSECPENTFSAFRAAIVQGYDVIELDPGYTKDKKIVILHDNLINRTATRDGLPPAEEISINDITYSEALGYDFGAWVSKKFTGEKIPLLSDVLEFAKENKIPIKVDGKIAAFPQDVLDIFFAEVKDYSQYVSVTAGDIEFTEEVMRRLPGAAIDYDGVVDEQTLQRLGALIPRERLTVWLPYECENTSWVTVPFADENLAALVKKYAKLGIWLITDYQSFYDAAERLKPDIVETDGTVKPVINAGCRYDMHTHSENSHDSECPVRDMKAAAEKNGLSGFAVTDHCDVEYYQTMDLDTIVKNSIADAKKADGNIRVLHGTEIGEGFWYPDVADKIIKKYDLDVVIGSVHAAKFDGYEIPYSRIDFAKMGKEKVLEYLNRYFDDVIYMLENCDYDIAAHITCPLRYINGKYGMNVDCRQYEDKIRRILECIIKHRAALEINTSCAVEGSEYNELMPEEWIIKMYKDMGGYLITTGSDAHVAKNSANSFGMLYDMLRNMGFKNIYCYKNRCAVQCAII